MSIVVNQFGQAYANNDQVLRIPDTATANLRRDLTNTNVFKNVTSEEQLLLEGYNVGMPDTSNVSYAPYIISLKGRSTPSGSDTAEQASLYRGKYITAIKLQVVTTGTLTIGTTTLALDPNTSGYTWDPTTITKTRELTISSTGEQKVNLDEPLFVESNESLFICLSDDTVTFKYKNAGTNPKILNFYFKSQGALTSLNYQAQTLGINIYGTDVIGYGLSEKSIYDGKTLSILGDSISTYAGYISSGNATWYPTQSINNVNQTWWYKVTKSLGMTINTNNSCSGSCVSFVRNDRPTGISRCTSLDNGTNPDVIIVWMGINDFVFADSSQDSSRTLGSYDGSTAFPAGDPPMTFSEGYGKMLHLILDKYKTSEVWVCLLPTEDKDKLNDRSTYPKMNANNNTKLQYSDTIKSIADAYGVKVIELNKCGLTWENLGTYTDDGLHPNVAGHNLIANKVIRTLDPMIRRLY